MSTTLVGDIPLLKYGQICMSEVSLKNEIVRELQTANSEMLTALAKLIYQVELREITGEDGEATFVSYTTNTRKLDDKLSSYRHGVELKERAKALLLRLKLKGSDHQFRAKARLELVSRGIVLSQAEFQRVCDDVLNFKEVVYVAETTDVKNH
jgi:hypothetical protein